MEERLWILKSSQWFHSLTNEQLAELERHARMRTFARNTPIYLPQDQADGVFLLATGRVRISHLHADGRQSILGFIETGELFGELSIIDSGERHELAEAHSKSLVIWFPAANLERVMAQAPTMALQLTKLIGSRRLRVERRLSGLLFRTARERMVQLLCELCDQISSDADANTELRLPFTHQELADLIGSTRETVTLLLGEFQTQGWLTLGRKCVIVRRRDLLQPDGLFPTAESSPSL